MINYKIVAKILCSMAVLETILLFLALAVGIFYGEKDLDNFYWSVAISLTTAVALYIYGRDSKGRMTRREGYLSVAATWLMFTIIGSVVNGEHNDKEDIGSFGNIVDAQYAETIQEQFFAKDFEDSFFYRYLAK